MKLLTWNINGIRAALKKGLIEKLTQLDADIIAFQEIKCQDEDMFEIFKNLQEDDIFGATVKKNKYISQEEAVYLANYKTYWHTSKARKGYSGTSLMVKNELAKFITGVVYFLENEKFNDEGRLTGITIEKDNQKHLILNGYYPQGGREGRVSYKIEFYLELNKMLNKYRKDGFNIILCGDLNTTVKDIDLARPKENKKTTGCLPEERIALNWLIETKQFEEKHLIIFNSEFEHLNKLEIEKLDLIDSTRFFYPDTENIFSYWDQITRARDRNVGWRIDYWLVDKNLEKNIKSCEVLSEVMGSDHCPVALVLDIEK